MIIPKQVQTKTRIPTYCIHVLCVYLHIKKEACNSIRKQDTTWEYLNFSREKEFTNIKRTKQGFNIFEIYESLHIQKENFCCRHYVSRYKEYTIHI
jgi:hypothetical protein